MNLLGDLEDIIKKEYQKHGFEFRNKDTHELIYGLLNLKEKVIIPKRRKVNYSKELLTKNMDTEYKTYLGQIELKFSNGDNINPYLGKGSFRPFSKDLMLYDWGIYHLHLNKEVYNKDFIIRSDYLLFFMIKDKNVYFIDVTKHQLPDRTEFAQQNLLKIIKRNWPYLLEPYKLKGISLPKKFTDQQRKEIRNAGSMAATEIDGDIYAMLGGGGISSAKTNIKYTTDSDNIHQTLREIEDRLKQSKKKLKYFLREMKLKEVDYNFKLLVEDGSIFVINDITLQKVIEINNLYDKIFFFDDIR
ncbi:hypothetical protein [Peribacillus frigoritolerans]|uniref:hypothetical protein n=1 Tax=Peribacillus frigoritolerans TaxID=450367 RepID=UPI0020C16AC8|nr:hypothetical protein [Peribacillus frigoritolerans]